MEVTEPWVQKVSEKQVALQLPENDENKINIKNTLYFDWQLIN